MTRKFVLASLLVAGSLAAATAPAHAGGWASWGPQGGSAHWGAPTYGGYYGGYPHPSGGCCYAGGVAAGAVTGLAVGTAVGVTAASHPAYVAPPAVVYAAPPVAYAPPPVVYAPGGYYYVR